MVRPPLTLRTCPVTWRADSEARNVTAAAMSWGCASRRSGVALISLSTTPPAWVSNARSIGVSVGPGETQLTVI